MRILIADDDPISSRVLEATLTRWGYDIDVAADGSEAWQILSHPDAPPLAVIDWMMPGMDGPDLCRKLRSADLQRYTYVLLLTSKQDEADIVEGLSAGADDYITKPFKAGELKVRLRAGNRILQLERELVTARDALHKQATHDALTGILNHGAILARLDRELSRSRRTGGSLSLLMCDIDHFKQVNDTFGHLIGDAVLVETTRRLSDGVRLYDAAGRYGGEEFVVVLPGCAIEDAAALAERLRRSIGERPVETAEGRIAVTVSFGAAHFDPANHANFTRDGLLKLADDALYGAKDSGRDRVCVATNGRIVPFSELFAATGAGVAR